jgi:ferric-dicitrate binding protein FerR (iron transport regulator)
MSVREEAARWFTILHRGVMTLEERAVYERWLTKEPHRRALAEMQQVWDMFEAPRHSLASAPALDPAQPARKVMVASMCVVSLCILALSYAHTSFWTSLDWVTR